MPALSSWYCGIRLYFSNSSIHCASLSGGMMPVIGFHSVIERPLSVRRVAPPTRIMANTTTAHDASQIPT